MIYEAFPKWKHKMEEIIAVGDKVIARAIDYTTHEGEFQGIPATGNKVEFGVIVIYSIDKGKIVEMREEGDMLGFFQQLGMELKPKEAEK
jgi:predicted ester cyclase